MRFEIDHAHQNDVLDDVKPGDHITIRAFVQEVRVEALDVQTHGGPPAILNGPKSVSLIVEEITR